MAGYTVIDNDEDLRPMEKLTLIMLIKFNNQLKGYAYPSLEVLKNLLGYSHIKYVIKIIDSLIEKGYIKKETVKQKNHYYILKGSVQKVTNVQNIPKDRTGLLEILVAKNRDGNVGAIKLYYNTNYQIISDRPILN
ncbi:helix-turn-helix domain-containing protein [Clostridium sp.]